MRSPPTKFGAIKNAHHIKSGEDCPWNSTFEPDFNRADNQFPFLAEQLLKLESKSIRKQATFEDRLVVQSFSDEFRAQLAEALSSLIVRSPCSRSNIRTTIEHFWHSEGFRDYVADKSIIAANMQANHRNFTHVIHNGGKFLALISDGPDFIFGDGFLHDFPINADGLTSCRCVVPLLPSVAVLFVKPPVAYRTQPEFMTIGIRADEVQLLNEFVQLYSCDRIFYRHKRPKLIDEFAKRKHWRFQYHDHPWLSRLIHSVVSFCPEVKF